MKKIIGLLFLFLLSNCASLEGQNKDIAKDFVRKVISSYNEKDSETFNDFLNKDIGLFIITKMGSYNYWVHPDYVCLTQDCLEKKNTVSLGPYQHPLKNYTTGNLDLQNIVFTDKPYFECEDIEKKGIFISSVNKYHTLSNSINILLKYEIEEEERRKELENKIKLIKKLEGNSRRVVVNSINGTFIFYVTKLNGKWYLTIVDFATTDCSV